MNSSNPPPSSRPDPERNPKGENPSANPGVPPDARPDAKAEAAEAVDPGPDSGSGKHDRQAGGPSEGGPREASLADTAEGRSDLGERLDRFYRTRKEAGDLQTTEIPISMLMALDKLTRISGDVPGVQPGTGSAPGAVPPTPIPGHPDSPVSASAARDPESVRELSGHLKRVAAFARLLALKTGMSEKEANFVKQISPMHDIGKWAIPEAILQKPGSLTPEEWEIMKTHTSVGYEMLKDSKVEVLRMGALVAVQHQEKYDGTGYPGGLKGDQIHIYSRITTVADVFDALGSERSYKQAWPLEEIVRYFQDGRGTHFDPVLVDLLLAHIDEFLAIRKTFA